MFARLGLAKGWLTQLHYEGLYCWPFVILWSSHTGRFRFGDSEESPTWPKAAEVSISLRTEPPTAWAARQASMPVAWRHPNAHAVLRYNGFKRSTDARDCQPCEITGGSNVLNQTASAQSLTD